MASQPFQQCLRHTQFENWSLRESNFWRINQFNHCLPHTYFRKKSISTNQLASLDKSPNSTGSYDIHIFKHRVLLGIIWRESTIQPIQPAVATHIFFKCCFARNYFCEDLGFNQFNHQMRQLCLGQSLSSKQLAKNGKSTISTVFATHTI